MWQQKKNKGKGKAPQAHAFEGEGFVHEVIMDEVMLNEAAESFTQVNLDPWSEYDNNMAREESEWFKEIIGGTNFNSWKDDAMNVDIGMETADIDPFFWPCSIWCL